MLFVPLVWCGHSPVTRLCFDPVKKNVEQWTVHRSEQAQSLVFIFLSRGQKLHALLGYLHERDEALSRLCW
jgi:hypothetical protein